MIEVGNIIKNLIPTEAVVVNKIQKLGTMYSLKFTGVNTNKSSSKVITEEQFSSLEVLTSDGEFNFKGDPDKFVLFAEAERINSAYQFDPLFAINCSVVDPLPHQVEAVYKFLLPQPKIRFLLADSTPYVCTVVIPESEFTYPSNPIVSRARSVISSLL